MAVVRCARDNMVISAMSRTFVTSNRDCTVTTLIHTAQEQAYVEVYWSLVELHGLCIEQNRPVLLVHRMCLLFSFDCYFDGPELFHT